MCSDRHHQRCKRGREGANRSMENCRIDPEVATRRWNTALPLTIRRADSRRTCGGHGNSPRATGTAKLTLGGATANTYTGLTRGQHRSGGTEQAGGAWVAVGGEFVDLRWQRESFWQTGRSAMARPSAWANAGSLIRFRGGTRIRSARCRSPATRRRTVGITGARRPCPAFGRCWRVTSPDDHDRRQTGTWRITGCWWD